MDKIFVSDYSHENDIWKMYTLNKDDSLKYFNISNKNNIDEKKLNLLETNSNNCNYMNLSNKILYSIMNNNCIDFLNVYDNKFYKVYNVFFNYVDCPIILNYCNEDEPFIVVQTSSYMDLQYIFYINTKEIIKISQSTADHGYYFKHIIATINFVKNNTNNIKPVSNYKKYLFFGFNMNLGHHLWNEISGLYYFLENNEYHNKIDGIIIGPFDSFNMESFLKKKYNFNILKFTDIFQECRHNYFKNLTDIFPIVLNSFYIDKNVKNLIDNTINDETNLIDNNILEISIDIRTYRRYLINQDIFYTKLIQKLADQYKEYKLKINFLGCFQTNTNTIDKTTHEEYIEQTKIVNNIIEKFNDNKNLIFKNLIGEYFFDIKNHTFKSKLFINILGTSSSNIINWIYNTKVISSGPVEAYGWSDLLYNVLQNYNVILSPKEYTLTNNGLQEPFDLDFDLFYSFFIKELNKIILIPN
jgi:hypothetical protein